eukprot:6484941-Amphidinium_carterae.1
MSKLRASARRALGKGIVCANLPLLNSMAHGGPAGDPQVSADLMCGLEGSNNPFAVTDNPTRAAFFQRPDAG